MSAPYDLIPYIARDADGWLRVRCHVTWTPRRSDEITITGDHLDIKDGAVVLTCGIYDACEQLGLPDPEDEHALAISALVDKQLALRTCAELHCPEGHLRVELVEPPCRE